MSRDEAIKKMKAVKAYMTAGNPIWGTEEIAEAFDAAIEALEREPKKGKWELIDGKQPRRYGCSRCKRLVWFEHNFCPNCGAKMEEAGDDPEE